MKIDSVEISNFKRLVKLEIDVSTNSVVIICGQNGEGKSSALDAIAVCLGGVALAPPEPLRRGEKSGHVKVKLSDGRVAERRWTGLRDGSVTSKLQLFSPDGQPVPKPQAVLDDLIGILSWDPEAFDRAKPKEQLEIVRGLTGVNLATHDAKRRDLYEQRTSVNREVDAAKNAVEDMGSLLQPGAPVDVAALVKQQEEMAPTLRARADVLAKFDAAAAKAKALVAEADRLKVLLVAAQEARGAAIAAEKEAAFEVDALPPPPDSAAISKQILDAQEINAEVAKRRRELQARDARQKDYAKLKAEADALTDQIKTIDEEKAAMVGAAKFPIPELGFGEEGVTYRGLPLEQASGAERLRVSLAIGVALNPTLRVMQIRSGSLLDEKSMALVADVAKATDSQIWLEVVASSAKPGCFLIQDGRLAEEAANADAD